MSIREKLNHLWFHTREKQLGVLRVYSRPQALVIWVLLDAITVLMLSLCACTMYWSGFTVVSQKTRFSGENQGCISLN